MSAGKKIVFHIDKQGNTTVKDVCGFGTSCQQTTADIEKLLGAAQEGSRETTDQYHIPVQQDVKLEL